MESEGAGGHRLAHPDEIFRVNSGRARAAAHRNWRGHLPEAVRCERVPARPQTLRVKGDFPLRQLRHLLVVLVLAAVALGGVGEAARQPAGAAPGETPARKITRLRAKAARVQAAIERMNARVEGLVEDCNEVREALARTRAEQARTRRQVLDARRRLRAARRQLGKRLWRIYTGGAPSTLGQLLGADSVHQALVTPSTRNRWSGRTEPPSTGSSGSPGRSRRSPPSWPTRPSARSACRPAWPPSAARSRPAWPPSAATSSA